MTKDRAFAPIGQIGREFRQTALGLDKAIRDLVKRVAALEAGGGGSGGSGDFSMSTTFPNPVQGAEEVMWVAPYPCTVQRLRGYREGGAGVTLNATIDNNHTNAVDLSVTASGVFISGESDGVTAMAVGDVLRCEIVSVSGTPSLVVMQIDLTT